MKKFIKLKWYEDTDFAYTDAGVDKAKVWKTAYKNYYITAYPVKLFDKNEKGWEYRIIHGDDEYDSIAETIGSHAETPEEAMEWAKQTLEIEIEVSNARDIINKHKIIN
jgi:hypothetical protein